MFKSFYILAFLTIFLYFWSRRTNSTVHLRGYQLSENVKTTLQLLPALALYFLLLFNSSFVQLNFEFKVIPSQYGQSMALIVSNLITSFLQMLIQICILAFHPVLNRRCRFIFAKFSGCRHNRVEPIHFKLDNKMMTMERHFEILNQYWK